MPATASEALIRMGFFLVVLLLTAVWELLASRHCGIACSKRIARNKLRGAVA